MRTVSLFLLLAVIGARSVVAQTPASPPPQTARQALIEMFLGKGEGDFAKHLPEAAKGVLIHKGENPDTSIVLRISAIGRQMVAQGEHIETFDAGSTMLVSEQNDGHEKTEVVVEHDSLLGEEDEIELSVHIYKDGQPQPLLVIPRIIFTLKQEKEIWRLTEVTVAAHVPLTDADYIQGLRSQQDESNESAAQGRMSMIAQAETSYAANHPDHGYICSLTNLFAPPSGGEPAPYYIPAFANEEANGYRFTLTGCDGVPALKYRVTAVPADPDSSMKAFCTDESGTIRFVNAGKSSTCFRRGQVVSTTPAPNYGID